MEIDTKIFKIIKIIIIDKNNEYYYTKGKIINLNKKSILMLKLILWNIYLTFYSTIKIVCSITI